MVNFPFNVEKERLIKKRHKITRKQVQVEVLPPPIEPAISETLPQLESTLSSSSNVLLVSNLQENVDEHLIEMYFENPKSGGYDGAVENVDFVEPKVVRITFTNSEGEYNFSNTMTENISSQYLVGNALETSGGSRK